MPLHLLTRLFLRRSGWPPRFLGAVGWIVGARVTTSGEPVQPHSLLLCNHLSWLDIFVLSGATGCAFVSKSELGEQPVLGWLADQNRTIYVKRSQRSGAAEQAKAITEFLEQPQPLALFPEGTIGPGDELLPFRSTLLAAVVPQPPQVEVRPVAIDYGPAATEISWHTESAKSNLLRVLGRRGTLPVKLHLLPPLARTDDRKTLAREAQQAVANALASSRAAGHLYARAR